MVTKIYSYIRLWECRCYGSGIPDECEREIESNQLAPSYRQIAIAILKNDYQLKSLGFDGKVSQYYNRLKKIELAKRGLSIQLNLFE